MNDSGHTERLFAAREARHARSVVVMDRATLLRVFHHVYQTTPRTEENAALLNEVAEVLTREWTP